MMTRNEALRLGYSDYWDIWLKRSWDAIELERYHPLDYEYMEDYINDRTDTLDAWRDDVYNWNTTQSYDDWLSDYEYPYEDYFNYNSDTDESYDENDSDYEYTYYYAHSDKDVIIQQVIEEFDENFAEWHFEFGWDIHNYGELRDEIARLYDDCKEYEKQRDEAKKPHRDVFSYYK